MRMTIMFLIDDEAFINQTINSIQTSPGAFVNDDVFLCEVSIG